MEFLILTGAIIALIVIRGLFINYREGRDAILTLAQKEKHIHELLKAHNFIKEDNIDKEKRIAELKKAIEEKDNLYKSFENAKEGIFKLASLFADFKTVQYDISARFLATKKHPAIAEAQRIGELKRQTKGIIEKK